MFSRHTVLGRLCNVKIMITVEIGTWEEPMENLIVSMPMTTTVECLRPLRGTGCTRPSDMMTGVRMVMSGELLSTHESLGSMRDLFSYKAWSTETELTEMAMTEARKPATGCMSLAQSASAELSELQ